MTDSITTGAGVRAARTSGTVRVVGAGAQTRKPEVELFTAEQVGQLRLELSELSSFVSNLQTMDRIEDVGDDGVALGVTLQDEDGADWAALYSLEKQPDGAWRITGCRLTRAPGSNA